MGATRGPRRSTALALVIAIGVAALAGYLFSRPQDADHALLPVAIQAPVPRGPFSTIGYSVADDPDANEVVVFGGDLSLNRTWLWNGGAWQLSHPRTSPPGREEAATAYDPALRMVVLFGGIRPPQTYLDDTWGWNGTTWHELSSGGPPPGQASMAWDPAVNAMVLVPASSSGADTWTFTGTHWVDHHQPDPYIPTGVLSLAFDPLSNILIAVGFGDVISPSEGSATQTWTWNGAVWQELTTRHTPSAYELLGLAWDPATAKLLLFGEGSMTPVPQLNWEWTGSDWTQLPPLAQPRIIEGLLTGVDTGRLLLVGEPSEARGSDTPINVWGWTGRGWQAASSTLAVTSLPA